MPTIAKQTAYNERLSVILREHNIDPATVPAGSVKIVSSWPGSGRVLSVTVRLEISQGDADFIDYGTERKGNDHE